MTGYQVWPAGKAAHGAVTLTPIRQQDMEPIRVWRNAQMDILRQAHPLTPEDQGRYWQQVVAPGFSEAQPRQILVSALSDGACVAYGGLVHIDWSSQRAEVSFLAATEIARDTDRYAALFADFLGALKVMAFNHLRLHRLFTETYDVRPHHVRVLEGAGFALEGRMVDHVRIDGRFVDSLLHGCVQ